MLINNRKRYMVIRSISQTCAVSGNTCNIFGMTITNLFISVDSYLYKHIHINLNLMTFKTRVPFSNNQFSTF